MGYLFLTNQRLVGILSFYLRTLSKFGGKMTHTLLKSSYQPRLGGLIKTTRGRPQFCYVSEHLCSTGRADTMAGIARSSGLLTLPADTPLTPGTFNQVIALTQRDKLLAILRLEIAISCEQRISVP